MTEDCPTVRGGYATEEAANILGPVGSIVKTIGSFILGGG